MTRFYVGLVTVLAIIATALGIQAAFDAEKQSEPPHVAPPAAEVTWPLAVVGADQPWQTLTDIGTWIEGIKDASVAYTAGGSAVRSNGGLPGPGAPASQGGCGDDWDCFRECTIDHESRTAGMYGAVSPGGVYRGAYQFLGSTWRSVSVNAGLGEWADTPVDQVPPDVQDAVARFLWEHSGNSPWGGRC